MPGYWGISDFLFVWKGEHEGGGDSEEKKCEVEYQKDTTKYSLDRSINSCFDNWLGDDDGDNDNDDDNNNYFVYLYFSYDSSLLYFPTPASLICPNPDPQGLFTTRGSTPVLIRSTVVELLYLTHAGMRWLQLTCWTQSDAWNSCSRKVSSTSQFFYWVNDFWASREYYMPFQRPALTGGPVARLLSAVVWRIADRLEREPFSDWASALSFSRSSFLFFLFQNRTSRSEFSRRQRREVLAAQSDGNDLTGRPAWRLPANRPARYIFLAFQLDSPSSPKRDT